MFGKFGIVDIHMRFYPRENPKYAILILERISMSFMSQSEREFKESQMKPP